GDRVGDQKADPGQRKEESEVDGEHRQSPRKPAALQKGDRRVEDQRDQPCHDEQHEHLPSDLGEPPYGEERDRQDGELDPARHDLSGRLVVGRRGQRLVHESLLFGGRGLRLRTLLGAFAHMPPIIAGVWLRTRRQPRGSCSSATSSAGSAGALCWTACRGFASATSRRSSSSTPRTSPAAWGSRRRAPRSCCAPASTRSRWETTRTGAGRSTPTSSRSDGSCAPPTSCAASPATARRWSSVTGCASAWSTSAAICSCVPAERRSPRSSPRWRSSARSTTCSWTCTPRRRRRRSRWDGTWTAALRPCSARTRTCRRPMRGSCPGARPTSPTSA